MVTSELKDSAPKIINISNYDLKPDEISVLMKGPKFCPTPLKPDLLNLEVDIAEFTRTMELIVAAHDWKNSEEDYLIRKKSDYEPLPNKDPFFANICSQIRDFATTLPSLPTPKWKNNISSGERKAISNLQDNSEIRITRVDKGSSWVIINMSDYINVINSSLNDSSIYKKLPKNKDKKVMSKIKTFTNKFRACFDPKGKEKEYIEDFDFQTANLYGLPKIHKSVVLKNEISNSDTHNSYLKIDNCNDIPFRLINGGENAPTSKLSEFLDILLKPFCLKVPSYLKDYVDFLNKIPNVIPNDLEDITFVTCDVVNMYGNITFELGKKAVWYWLAKFPDLLHERFSNEFVIEGLELVMKNSNFCFNGSFYTLIKGTATGTVVAPAYAILAMGFLEVSLYEQIEKAFGKTIQNYFVLNWKRYLDDCFILWKKSFGDFQEVLNILNNLDSNLKFTCEQNDAQISFLNILIYKNRSGILTDMYYKDTDTHDYLPYNSCHPRHTKNNIPKNLARMICCIVDDPERRDMRLQELFSWLSKCGYPHLLIHNAFQQILSLDRESFRQKVSQEDSKSIVFVQTQNPKNPHVFWKLRQQFDSLIGSAKFGHIFKDYSLIKGERQTKNMGRILQKSNISPDILPQGSFKCNKSNCGTCPYLIETDNVIFDSDGGVVNFKLLGNFSCASKHVIYKITCIACRKYYIGETKYIRDRVTGHKFSTFNQAYRAQYLHNHLFDCNGGKKICFEFVPFFYVKQKTARARLTVENNFIRKFQPELNG